VFTCFSIWKSNDTCKNCRVLFISSSSAPYIGKEIRDVGEVPTHKLESLRSLILPTHKLESLRSLILNVEMFLDLINVVGKTFKIPFLQKDILSFQFSLKFFVHFCTWSEEDKVYYLSLIVTPLEDDKFDVSFRV
jgi:hypothetical protein